MALKRCTHCHHLKVLIQFHRNAGKPDGLNDYCKECRKEYEQHYRQKPEYKDYRRRRYKLLALDPTYRAKRCAEARLYSYGLDHKAYAALLVLQNGRCAICDDSPARQALHVDHNHDTGAIRGLLCRRCNFLVGHLESALRPKAEVYLKKHEEGKHDYRS